MMRTYTLGLSLGLTIALAMALAQSARADVPAAIVNEQTRLSAIPERVNLIGQRGVQQVLIMSRGADGQVRDLTRHVRWTSTNPAVVAVEATGIARAKGDGEARLRAEINGRTVEIPVTVSNTQAPAPVSFRDEVIPALNRAGCNQGACHGTPNGKGGFRLSLRGYDVPFDYKVLSRDFMARRVSTAAPEESLLIQKGTGRVPHQGGQRLIGGSQEYHLLCNWIAEGMKDDPKDLPELVKLEVLPARRIVNIIQDPDDGPSLNDQQLVVLGHFADGKVRDVTHLCAYSTSNDDIAEVGQFGLVKPRGRGEVAVLARYLQIIVSARMMFLVDRPGFVWPNTPERNYIDRILNAKLKQLQIPPSPTVGDSQFLRRAYLDAIGALPTPDETRAFLADPDPLKREKLIDKLLARSEFADFWTLKWADILRVNESFMDEKGVKDMHSWIRRAVVEDRPLDQFVRDLLAASGNSADSPTVNFYRTMANPEEMAETISQLFMGVRMNCAKCHNHPFERWTQDEYFSLAAFFAKMRLHKHDPKEKQAGTVTLTMNDNGRIVHPRTNLVVPLRFPGEPVIQLPPQTDPRKHLVDWLVNPQNAYFTRTLANRIWFHLMGRGIVEPVDDFRDSNPAISDELLDALAQDLAKNGYRLKHLVRTIMLSETYQRTAQPNELNKDDTLYFSRAQARLLTAEQMLDAICALTGVPESHPRLPAGARAVQIEGAKTDNMFLKVFNRPARNLACECERERESNLSQALQLIANRSVQDKIHSDKGRVARLIREGKDDDQIIDELYLAGLCRLPSPRERQAIVALLNGNNRREVFEDLTWTIINTKEFQFRY